MADFRRLFYALALVALLAGLTVPVSAQAAPFTCTANAGATPIVRAEGYTELVGDVTLTCTGGTPTQPGGVVPQANFTIFLNTNITSKLTMAAGGWTEALLIVDEPHTPENPNTPILNCGATGAPDNGPSGAGVCAIEAKATPELTYNGSTTCAPPGTAGQYGCGAPNIFQARSGTLQNPGQFTAVTFSGVPVDPPGTTTTRTFRFTNIRADAESLGAGPGPIPNQITAIISVSGNTVLTINNPQIPVAFIEKGLFTSASSPVSFLQCIAQNPNVVPTGTGTGLTNSPSTATFTFQEGFQSSWKAKNIAMVTNQQPGNGVAPQGAAYWQYTGFAGTPTFNYPADLNQNVPGAPYYTESGFQYTSNMADPVPNPPLGSGPPLPGGIPASTPLQSGQYNNLGGAGTGIAAAGIASQGTRLAIQITAGTIPAGSIVLVPQAIFLSNNGGTNHTGVAVLTTTAGDGSGPYSAPSGTISANNYVQVQSSGLIVYEVLFADPFSIETASVPIVVAYVPNLASNQPAPGVTATATGMFAPFFSTMAAKQPSATLPVPRFVPSNATPSNLFTIFKCSCDVLFPYIVSAGGYDSGIAIANTSLDPGSAFGFSGTPQAGAVQFWYYGSTATGGAPPTTQCTNTTSPGTCPGTTVVPAGQVLTYVMSTGSSVWGLDNRGNGFLGYVIAQAQFQYCHAFAFIGALGAGPLSPGISEGYLGLIMSNPTTPLIRVAPAGEALNQ